MITQDQVKDLFDYRDGELYWKVKLSNRIKIGDKAGNLDGRGYWQTRINGKNYLIHRIVFLMFNGYLPKKIDHANTNSLDNKIDNLRPATNFENGYNAKTPKNNTSGVKGVYWNKRQQKWHVQLAIKGKVKFFGQYHDIEVAKFIAETMRYKYHGAFANHGGKTN